MHRRITRIPVRQLTAAATIMKVLPRLCLKRVLASKAGISVMSANTKRRIPTKTKTTVVIKGRGSPVLSTDACKRSPAKAPMERYIIPISPMNRSRIRLIRKRIRKVFMFFSPGCIKWLVLDDKYRINVKFLQSVAENDNDLHKVCVLCSSSLGPYWI